MNRSMKHASRVVGQRFNVCKWVAVVAMLGLAAQPAGAVDRRWIGGNGTWDNTTTANWSGGVMPVPADNVLIDQSGVTVNYAASPVAAPGFAGFYLQHSGAGTNTFTLDGADHLRVDASLRIGLYVTGAVVFNLTGTAILEMDGLQGLYLGDNTTSSAVFNHSGGTFISGVTQANLFNVNKNGTYNLSGTGQINSNRGLSIANGGSYNQTGGTANWATPTDINGSFSLSGGIYNGANFTVGANATALWTGGTITVPAAGGRLQLTGVGASWTQKGGTLTINVQGNSGANTLTLVPSSTIQGYGTIQDARFGASSPGTFNNSGRVVANGYGASQDLNLTRFGQTTATSMIINSTDNTGSNGWFAVSGGKLLLPNIAVMAGSSVTNWGEATADTTIDLVNSARIAFTGATAGNLTGALLAVDRADVPAGLYRPTAVWTFGGVTCASATLTLRYDDAAAAALTVGESDLRVWRHNGTKWLEITGTQDTGTKTITSQATGSLAVTSFFAVAAKAPAAGTLVTLR